VKLRFSLVEPFGIVMPLEFEGEPGEIARVVEFLKNKDFVVERASPKAVVKKRKRGRPRKEKPFVESVGDAVERQAYCGPQVKEKVHYGKGHPKMKRNPKAFPD
jgi:hypothetical protein